jgi:hypothetical protein
MSEYERIVLERLKEIARVLQEQTHEQQEQTRLLRLLVEVEEPKYAKPQGVTFAPN